MKKIALLICLLSFSCSKKEEATPNQAPSTFIITPTLQNDGKTIILTWTAAKDTENDAVTYDVELDGKTIASNLTTTTFTITGLDFDNSKAGKIIAKDSKGLSTVVSFIAKTDTDDNKTVFIANDKKLYALDAKTGLRVWESAISFTSSRNSLLLNKGVIYLAATNLTSIDISTGQKKEDIKVDNFEYGPIITNDTLIVGNSTNYFNLVAVKIDKASIWSYSNRISSSPTIAGNTIYLGCASAFSGSNGNLIALDLKTGKEKWAFNIGQPVKSSPAVSNGIVYVGSDNKKIYAIDANNGTKKWEFLTGGIVNSSPTIDNGVVYIGSQDSKLYAIDATNGSKKWEFSTKYQISSSPTIINGIVYVGSDKLYAIDAKTGTGKWEFDIKFTVSSPVVANGIVYIGSLDNKLYAIDADSGMKKWEFATLSQLQASAVVVSKSGKVFYPSFSGMVQ